MNAITVEELVAKFEQDIQADKVFCIENVMCSGTPDRLLNYGKEALSFIANHLDEKDLVEGSNSELAWLQLLEGFGDTINCFIEPPQGSANIKDWIDWAKKVTS
ncbi:MAG: hypothetical protein P1P90_06690 [Patescibacteria group bacterium]|nr:hypothetical protein [Patescibacteria group bacterium]